MSPFVYEHPRPALTIDVVSFTIRNDKLQVLLIQRGKPPYENRWALPGGFVNIEENLEEAALRELEEETGVKNVYLEQLYTYGEPNRDPRGRVVTVAYFAIIPANTPFSREGGQDASKAQWFPISELPPLAFDHDEIINYALRRLRYKLEYTAIGFELLPEEFSLPELQRAYEIILGENIDKRNFRRRILQAGVIEATPHRRAGEGRPAQLYRYRENAIVAVKAHRLFP